MSEKLKSDEWIDLNVAGKLQVERIIGSKSVLYGRDAVQLIIRNELARTVIRYTIPIADFKKFADGLPAFLAAEATDE